MSNKCHKLGEISKCPVSSPVYWFNISNNVSIVLVIKTCIRNVILMMTDDSTGAVSKISEGIISPSKCINCMYDNE